MLLESCPGIVPEILSPLLRLVVPLTSKFFLNDAFTLTSKLFVTCKSFTISFPLL